VPARPTGRRLRPVAWAVCATFLVGVGACTNPRAARAPADGAGGARLDLVGTWVWTTHPRPLDARRGILGLLARERPGDGAQVRFDTLWLRDDGRHVTRRTLVRALLDTADRPGPLVPIPGIPITTDSGTWRLVRGTASGPGSADTLCTTSRGVAGAYCAPAALRGDTLAWGAGDDVRRFHRVPARDSLGGAAAPVRR
jgi:hypothetical protein